MENQKEINFEEFMKESKAERASEQARKEEMCEND